MYNSISVLYHIQSKFQRQRGTRRGKEGGEREREGDLQLLIRKYIMGIPNVKSNYREMMWLFTFTEETTTNFL